MCEEEIDMNQFEEGRRFTDENYQSKEEVQALYNQGDISSIWDKVLTYRSFFDVETELRDNNSSHYKVCLTHRLTSKAYNLQVKLIRQYVDLIRLPADYQKEMTKKVNMNALSATALFENISCNEYTVEKIATGEIENTSSSLFPLIAYQKAYRYALQEKNFNKETINDLNRLLSGEDLSGEVSLRKDERIDVINPLSPCPHEMIEQKFEDLLVFLSQENIPLLFRALTIIYFFLSVKPFEFSNEETAGLAAKMFLQINDLSFPGFALALESLAYTTSSSYFKRLKRVQDTLDLTYFIDATLPFLEYSCGLFEKQIHEYQEKKEEILTNIEIQHQDNTSNDIVVKEEPISFALPEFPVSSDQTKVEALTKKLLEVYPQLKKKQAHFYAGHCQIGLHYTIEQFKKAEKTVYETARTSMEDLANRGFYRKEQIGKKFVYTPVPIKESE